MERDERNIYIKGITLCAVFIILAVYLYTLPVRAKNSVLSASESQGGKDIAESEKIDLRAVFDDSTGSGMPCDNPEQFERWLEAYEQEASEEEEPVESGEADTAVAENLQETVFESETLPEVETSAEVPSKRVEETAVVYSINGEVLNPELQALLYDALDRHGIRYWYEIGICQMWQESRGNIFAENPNGKDKGVLQYRLQYWDWNRGDIFDPAAQIELYAEQMAQRLNSGLSADECISRHNTSDHVSEVNWEYVAQVKQHLSNLREVK